MIKVRIVGQEGEENKFNGLVVILNVEESDGTRCEECGEEESAVITRRFNLVRVVRGALNLRHDTSFFREVQRFVLGKMGEGKCLCLDCYEQRADDELGGFEPAD